MLLQVAQDGGAVMGVPEGITQFGGKALEARGLGQEYLDFRRLLVDHFFQQVVTDQLLGAMHGQVRHVGRQFVAVGQQPQAQAGDPAFAALDQVVQGIVVELRAVGGDQLGGFLHGQAQVLLGELQQLPRQAQARQVPVRTLTAGDQYDQAGGLVIEQELQATVEHCALGQVIVVQHQQQRALDGQAVHQFIEQVIEPGFEGKGLVALAHFQQGQGFFAKRGEMQAQAFEQALEETPGVAVPGTEPQP